MADSRQDWCIRPNALLLGREQALMEDLDWILDNAPGGSFSDFKTFWISQNLTFLHRCLKPRESHTEFYQLIWGHVLSKGYADVFGLSSVDVKSKCVFFIYSLYMTQNRVPWVKINLDSKTWSALLTFARKNKREEAAMIQALISQNAFSLGVFLGLKTICPQATELSEYVPKQAVLEEECDLMTGLIDPAELETRARAYHFAKHEAVAGLKTHPEWFPPALTHKNKIEERLDSKDSSLLALSDPTLCMKIENAVKSVLPE